MGLKHEEELALGEAHAHLVVALRKAGFDLDYSLESLQVLERAFAVLRRAGADDPDGRRVLWPACAYVAEVLRRAVPEADLASIDGELVVTLPSRGVPRGSFKVKPLVRVGKLLQYEETLYGWALFFLGLAGHLETDADKPIAPASVFDS